jgi:hypothetical protein
VFRYCCGDLFLPAAYCREEEGRRERARAQGSLGPPIISFKREFIFIFFILLFASVQT